MNRWAGADLLPHHRQIPWEHRTATSLLLSRAVVKPSVLEHPSPEAARAPGCPCRDAKARSPARMGICEAEAEALLLWLPPAFIQGQG